jgi:hypothetical protein
MNDSDLPPRVALGLMSSATTLAAPVTLIATPPRIALDGARTQAPAADTYRQLSLFGDESRR